jgi:hypothetical protein
VVLAAAFDAAMAEALQDDDDDAIDFEDEETMAGLSNASKRRWDATKACCQVMVFLTFLILFSVVITVDTDHFERHLQKTLTTHFHQQYNSQLAPRDVNSYEKFWNYFENGFLVAAFGNETVYPLKQARRTIPLMPFLGGDEVAQNRLMGAIQLRQVKVILGSQTEDRGSACGASLAYSQYFPDCVPAYTPQKEYTNPVPGGTAQSYEYKTRISTRAHGVYATYGEGGYFELLNTNMSATNVLIADLKEDEWLNIQTRAIIIDFNTWNPNVEMYAAVRLLFEISPIGIWNFDVRVLLLKPRYLVVFGNGSPFEWFITICEFMVALFCLYYIAEEVSELWVSMSDYVQDAWNFVDWASLIVLLIYFYLRIITWYEASGMSIGIEESMDHRVYTDLQGYAENMLYARSWNAFNVILIWLKIVKYVPFLPYSQVLKELFSGSWQLLLSFFVIFGVFFVGFGLAFNVGFGMDYEELESWRHAWVYLGRSLLGDVDVTRVYQNAPLSGSILLGLFVLGIYMVLMNMWYALILHAFSQTRERLLEEQEGKGEKSLVEEFMDGIGGALRSSVDIERIVKKFPGLYARTVVKWRRQTAVVAKRRERRLAIEADRQMATRIDRIKSDFTIMPFHKSLDAKELAKLGGIQLGMENGGRGVEVRADPDADSEVSGASLDMGPLSPTKVHAKQKWKKRMGLEDKIIPELFELENAVASLSNQVLDRVKHIGEEVKAEMIETKEVLSGINGVLGVVNRRCRDLEVVQREHL